MGIERRSCPTAVTARADSDKRTIEGYASVYYDGTPETEYWLWSDCVERIAPGAFDRAIKEDDCRALFNHDSNCVLGRTTNKTLRLNSDKKGLRYEIDPPDTQLGRDVQELLKRGDVSGSSFGFEIRKVKWEEERDAENRTTYIRTITEAKLWDVGPVTYPAYEGASSGVRGNRSRDRDAASRESTELRSIAEERDAWIASQKTTNSVADIDARLMDVEIESRSIV